MSKKRLVMVGAVGVCLIGGCLLPFADYVALGHTFILPFPKEIWDMHAEEELARRLFILSGCLAAAIPALVSVLLLVPRTAVTRRFAIVAGCLALGSLCTMVYLEIQNWTWIMR